MNLEEEKLLKTYVMSDIHNNYKRFKNMLQNIQFSEDDKLYILGDVFDRSNYDPNPVDLYFQILALGDRCTVIRGNHDQWLMEYINKYFSTPEKRRRKIEPYQYNSFLLLQDRLTPIDIQNIADTIMKWPLQLEIEVNDVKYLLAHAMTSEPDKILPDEYYLTGVPNNTYLEQGIAGYISICGHSSTEGKILKNNNETIYVIDCGCGFKSGRLGCLCLESKEEYYV